MHIHQTPPACHSNARKVQAHAPGFKDDGQYCYQTLEQVETHDLGCMGCKRAGDKQIGKHDLTSTYKAEE